MVAELVGGGRREAPPGEGVRGEGGKAGARAAPVDAPHLAARRHVDAARAKQGTQRGACAARLHRRESGASTPCSRALAFERPRASRATVKPRRVAARERGVRVGAAIVWRQHETSARSAPARAVATTIRSPSSPQAWRPTTASIGSRQSSSREASNASKRAVRDLEASAVAAATRRSSRSRPTASLP